MTDPFIGEIRMFGGDFAPMGWAKCDGQELKVRVSERLHALIGNVFGGGDTVFNLPDLRGRIPLGTGTGDSGTAYKLGDKGGQEKVALTIEQTPNHTHAAEGNTKPGTNPLPSGGVWANPNNENAYVTSAPDGTIRDDAIDEVGGGQHHENVMPFSCVNFIIALDGADPGGRTQPHLGELRLFASTQVPSGWRVCDGSLLDISDNQALFSLIGTAFGGDGQRTFAIPDLQGRVPVGEGDGVRRGEKFGSETHTLTLAEMPSHTHPVHASNTSPGDRANPFASGKHFVWAGGPDKPYAAAPDGQLAPSAITSAGGGQPHSNMQPYTTVMFCIALRGDFPTRP